jgi:hypothetical protein
MGDSANTGQGAMKKRQLEPGTDKRSAQSLGAKTPESKARSQTEAETVARAVLEALSAHDPL